MVNILTTSYTNQHHQLAVEKEGLTISFKQLSRQILLIGVSLAIGFFNADIVGVIYLIIIISGFVTNNTENKIRSILLSVTWFFIYGFFVGQQSFMIPVVEKILVKPGLIFFLLLLIDVSSKYSSYKVDNIVRLHFILFLIIIISLFISPNSFSVLLTRHSYFFLYWLLLNLSIDQNEPNFFKSGLGLLISLAIIQVVIAYLQVFGHIPPPSIKLNLGDGEVMDWTSGLDDMASGTFGAMQSPDTSWFQTLIFGLCLTFSIIGRSYKFLFLGFLVMIQYTLVDSKTMLGVTIIFISIYLVFLIRNKIVQNRRLKYVFVTIITITIFGFIFMQLWQNYYKYYDQQVTRKTGFDTVQKYSVSTFNRVVEHINEWGKIRGFQNVLTVQSDESWMKTIVGFGPGNYLYETKITKVLALDTPLMKMNNFTRSWSGLLTTLAEVGILGFIIVLLIYSDVYGQINRSGKVYYSLDFRLLSIYLTSFIFGSLLCAFIYTTIKTHSKSIFGFWLITLLFIRFVKFQRISNASKKNTLGYV